MRWEKKSLAELCTLITKGTTPSNIGGSFTDSGINYIRSEMLTSSKYLSGEFLYISPETHEKLKRSQLHTGDILFSMAGVYLGKTAILRDEDVPANTNQAVALIRIDTRKCNRDFVYYCLNNPMLVKLANTIQSQSAQPNINLKQIGMLELSLPDSIIQDKIVSILAAYDDLIENNQKQIKLLEEAAQRLYKEWFMDLRFPGHENVKIVDGVPEVWEKTTLDDVIEFNPSISLSKERIKEFVPMSALSTSAMTLDLNEISSSKTNSGSRFQNDDTIMARITPCLENGKIAFVQELQSEEGAVGSTEYIVMRSKSLCSPMVYLLARTHSFRQYAINSMSGSDGRQRVKVERLREYEYLKPDTTLIEKFSGKVTPFFKRIRDLNKTNIVLQEARDRLLPKLMSGEIEV